MPLWYQEITSDSIQRIVRHSPTQEEYISAGALILLDSKIIEVYNDHSTSTSRLIIVKIFDDRGKSEYGDIKERYNNKTEEFQVITARTHTPVGKQVIVEPNAITDLSAPEVADAPGYTNARLKVVSFPALEPNAVIEYEYKILPKKKTLMRKLKTALFKKENEYFFGEVIFGGDEPIMVKEFKLIVPNNIGFKYKLVNSDVEPKISVGDKLIYTWELKDIPAIVAEPNMPPIEEIAPRLIFSSFNSWDRMTKWLADRFYKNIKVNRELKYEIWKLTQNKSEEEIIRDCFLYVTTQIRNVTLPFELADYTPNSALKVYANKYGTPIDKALLLCTFLSQAGINAFPVFVNTKGIIIRENVASPSLFNHIIVAIQGGMGYFLMDPQATDARFGYLPEEAQGIDGLILSHNSWTFNPTLTMPSEVNLSYSRLKLQLSGQGNLWGEIYTELNGFYDRRARRCLKNKTNKEKDIWVQGVISSIAANAKLISCSISDLTDLTMPVELDAYFEAKQYASVTDGTIQLFLPSNPFGFTTPSNYVSLSERKYPLIIRPPRVIQYQVELEFPEELAVDYLPQNGIWENEFAKSYVWCEELTPHKIVYNSELVFKKQRIETNEYQDFKSVVSEFLKPKTRLIILKKR